MDIKNYFYSVREDKTNLVYLCLLMLPKRFLL